MPHFRKIDQRDIPEYHCSEAMTRIISAPAVQVDIPAYISPASGKWINSRAQRREDLRREGCIENEPGLKEHIAACAASEREKSFQVIDKHIDQTVSEMHAANLI
jgi:hypothetical protein